MTTMAMVIAETETVMIVETMAMVIAETETVMIVETETVVVVVRLLAPEAHSRPKVSPQLIYILIFLIIVTNFKS
jgi:hypothetical protein